MEKFIHPTFDDNRGSYTPVGLKSANMDWEQCSVSINDKPFTFRGLHYQTDPPQRKYIKVIQGEIIDFAVDIETGEVDYEHLTPMHAVLIPDDKAHGFLTLKPNTIVVYLVHGEYNPSSEHSIPWHTNDHVKRIVNAYVGKNEIVISKKDHEGK